jgi:hypothetical protein
MRKETIVVGAVLLALAFAAFFMASLQHDELMNRERVEALAGTTRP